MPATATRKPDSAPPAAEPKSGKWVALTNLSISRPYISKDDEKAADIVHAGEVVTLTEEQSQRFLTGHKVPVIRPFTARDAADPKITARMLFGPRGRPTAAQFGARPDPKGASRVELNPAHPENHPEFSDPQTDLSVDPDAAKDR